MKLVHLFHQKNYTGQIPFSWCRSVLGSWDYALAEWHPSSSSTICMGDRQKMANFSVCTKLIFFLSTLAVWQIMLQMTQSTSMKHIQYYKYTHLLDTVTTDRIQMARTHGLDALVAPVTCLHIRLYWALITAHQCTPAVWERYPWWSCSTACWGYIADSGDQELQGSG